MNGTASAARGAARRPLRLAMMALLVLAGGTAPCASGARAGAASPSRPPGYGPADLRAAYNLGPLYARGATGRGQTIAFLEIDGYSGVDVRRFSAHYGLPAAWVTRYSFDARRGYRPSSRGLAAGPEATMDLEWAHALAPDARLVVYEVPAPTLPALLGQQRLASIRDALAAALSGGAPILSISLGAGGLSCLTVVARLLLGDLFAAAARQGRAVFASSGDSGDRQVQCGGGQGTSYPAAEPGVTAVGGTSLLLNRDAGTRAEVAWSGSGGGLNTSFRRPAWQYGAGLPRGPARAVPDVAFLADPRTGVSVLLDGAWRRFGGTSLGAPCWAAVWALLRGRVPRLAAPRGGANPLLYTAARGALGRAAFHDIVAGSNGAYSAGPGWDFVTGWGTPDAAALAAALANVPVVY
ncbi:MAG: hypothetical protein NVSMB65_15230 [Chloroflexota bacterium]